MTATADTIATVVATFRQAAEANRATPGRQGNIVYLSGALADDILIAADLHGHRLNFNRLVATANLAENPRRHLVMQEVCHGGPMYPSGSGCMSHLLLEDIARLKVEYPDRFHFILSNHELAELTDYPIRKGRRMLNLLFRCGVQEMYGEEAVAVRDAYLDFLRSLPLAVRLANGVFISHTLPEKLDTMEFDATVFERPWQHADLVDRGGVFRLVWGRDFRLENAQAFGRLVNAELFVHGHEPCPEGFRAPNNMQVILDCCSTPAYYLLLPVERKITHAELMGCVKRLPT